MERLRERKSVNKWVQALTLVLTVAFSSATAKAQEPELPQWHKCFFENKRWACYSLEETKALLILEARAQHLYATLELKERLIINYEQQIEVLKARVSAYRMQVEDYKKWTSDLVSKLKKEIKDKNKYRAKADSVSVWPVIVGGVLAFLGVGFGVGVWINAR